MSSKKSFVILTCEHGGNRIPKVFMPYFENARKALTSHRGWDPGALQIAKGLAKRLKAPLMYSEVSRLLIDLNRSARHPSLFSEFTRNLAPDIRRSIVETNYRPVRAKTERQLRTAILSKKTCLHLSIHSFTPVYDGEERTCEIGLLYDPTRPMERKFAHAFAGHLKLLSPDLRVRMNYPYKGTSDGFTSHLRKSHSPEHYAGLELEINQRLLAQLQKNKRSQLFIKSLAWIIDRTWTDLLHARSI